MSYGATQQALPQTAASRPLPQLWQLLFGPITASVSFLLHWIGLPPLFLIWWISVMGVLWLYKDEMSLELLFNWLSRLIVHLFFREYDSRNTHKIPPTGPVIFICNHNNQFLDPAVVQEFSPRPISWLIAAKSYRDPTIGKFAKAQRAIPVERPQDLAKQGSGLVWHPDATDPFLLTGTPDVDFIRDFTSDVVLGNDKNSFTFAGEIYRVEKVLSKNEIKLKASAEHHPPEIVPSTAPAKYKVTPHVDQHQMFKNVWDHLIQGGAVGIFPEGGSHDQTSMLPLKAGVAIMALGSAAQILDKYEEEFGVIPYDENNPSLSQVPAKFQSVSLIAVGLNYFNGHRFRGRVYAEFGDPFQVPFSLIAQYRRGGANKIDACNALLDIIRDQLKTVTVSAPSWTQLQVLWAVRRLYQPVGVKMPPKVVVVLIRRFAEGYELVKDRQDVIEVVKEVEHYNETLKYYGLRDHQVNITQQSRSTALLKLLMRCLFLCALAILSIPGALLNLPILTITRFISRKKASEALKASTVKVTARDVVASWKVLTALTIVPLVLCTYPVLIATFCSYYLGWAWLTVWGNFVILQPCFMWSAVLIVETGLPIFNSLKPLWLAVFPPKSGLADNDPSVVQLSPKRRAKLVSMASGSGNGENLHIFALRATRARLRYKIRALVDTLGPMIYGPGFEQLRVFPLRSHNVLPVGASADQAKSGEYSILISTDDRVPELIPQSIDHSDQDANTDDDISALRKRGDDKVKVYGVSGGSSGSGNKAITGTTTPIPATIPPPVFTTPAPPTLVSPTQSLTLSVSPSSPVDQLGALRSPLSPDSDDSLGSQEFILGSDGDYHYNHDRQLREMPISQQTIDMLYATPLMPQASMQQHLQPTPLGTQPSNSSNPELSGPVIVSQKDLSQPRLTTTASLSLLTPQTSDDEDKNDKMVQIDGLTVSEAHQHILLSRALQPLSPGTDAFD